MKDAIIFNDMRNKGKLSCDCGWLSNIGQDAHTVPGLLCPYCKTHVGRLIPDETGESGTKLVRFVQECGFDPFPERYTCDCGRKYGKAHLAELCEHCKTFVKYRDPDFTPKSIKYGPLDAVATAQMQHLCSYEKEKENDTMLKLDPKFGPINDGSVAISFDGRLAAKAGNDYFVFDMNTQSLINITSMVFKANKFIFTVPVQTLNVGDLLILDGNKVFLQSVDDDGIEVIIPGTNEVKIYNHPKLFQLGTNFTFYQKVISVFRPVPGMGSGLPFDPMMLMLAMSNNEGNHSDMMQMMALSIMMNNGEHIGQQPRVYANKAKDVVEGKVPADKSVDIQTTLAEVKDMKSACSDILAMLRSFVDKVNMKKENN